MTTFPTKVYASSSAAYRAIRQFEQKHGKTDLIMKKGLKGYPQKKDRCTSMGQQG